MQNAMQVERPTAEATSPIDTRYWGALEVPDRLEGARVIVRPFERQDAAAINAAIHESREHLRPWMPWASGHQTVEETLNFVAH